MLNRIREINLLVDLNDIEIKKMKKILGENEQIINNTNNNEPFIVEDNNTIIAGFIKENILYIETFQDNIKIL
ncbi:hypothetical protein [Dethiothermospora halolimnae]|uniref:hypothetical protein n=1 Tax=Dethiothermospora halolimnae TaxID=3114390 RepID=UPI003CCBB2CB